MSGDQEIVVLRHGLFLETPPHERGSGDDRLRDCVERGNTPA